MFSEMASLIPEGQIGVAKIQHRTPSGLDVVRARIHGEYLEERTLATLFVNGRMMMSDGPEEHRSNYRVVNKSKGSVLIAGLGIGMILDAILKKPEVSAVTVIEKYQDVIDLVSPFLKHSKLTIECADIFEWKPAKGWKFDTVYFDIWPDICVDNLEEISKLHQRFKFYKAKGGWMGSWNHEYLKYKNQRESRYCY